MCSAEKLASRLGACVPVCSPQSCLVTSSRQVVSRGRACYSTVRAWYSCKMCSFLQRTLANVKLNMAPRVVFFSDAVLDVSLQTEDMFFDPDDMDKFADEGTMDDDLEGESRVRDASCAGKQSLEHSLEM